MAESDVEDRARLAWRHPSHPHFLAPKDPAEIHAAHGGRWFCDVHQAAGYQGVSPAGQMWRCTGGCDFDVCAACLTSAARACSGHPHPMLEADPSVLHAAFAGKWFCDGCQPLGWTGGSPAGPMHHCIEGCDFDLCQMCLTPVHGLSWSFAGSRFKQRYDTTATPQYQHQVVGAVHAWTRRGTHAARHGVAAAAVHEFFTRIQQNAASAGGLAEFLNEVQPVAVRMWTSAEQLAGKELCGILNEALRDDEAVDHTAVISRALNAFCVQRSAGSGPSLQTRWPTSNETVRGGGLPQQHHAFFTVGTRYTAWPCFSPPRQTVPRPMPSCSDKPRSRSCGPSASIPRYAATTSTSSTGPTTPRAARPSSSSRPSLPSRCSAFRGAPSRTGRARTRSWSRSRRTILRWSGRSTCLWRHGPDVIWRMRNSYMYHFFELLERKTKRLLAWADDILDCTCTALSAVHRAVKCMFRTSCTSLPSTSVPRPAPSSDLRPVWPLCADWEDLQYAASSFVPKSRSR